MLVTKTGWSKEDLYVGRIVYVPPTRKVDPETRQATEELQKFKVAMISADGVVCVMPYHGDEPADMPPC